MITVLYKLRKENNLSQQELARRTNCHQSTLSLIERGYEIPRPRLLQKLADKLGFEGNPSDLLEEISDVDRQVTLESATGALVSSPKRDSSIDDKATPKETSLHL